MSENSFYIEFVQIGSQVKVTALDPLSGIEVSIAAPTTASQAEMTRVAVEKLKVRLKKLSEETSVPQQKTSKKDGRGGVLV